MSQRKAGGGMIMRDDEVLVVHGPLRDVLRGRALRERDPDEVTPIHLVAALGDVGVHDLDAKAVEVLVHGPHHEGVAALQPGRAGPLDVARQLAAADHLAHQRRRQLARGAARLGRARLREPEGEVARALDPARADPRADNLGEAAVADGVAEPPPVRARRPVVLARPEGEVDVGQPGERLDLCWGGWW
ncbi:hypothetical protein VSDG_00279 [Cytospora chrysosperma]|uniref:Uncharacterized protein n=1 Tax=Cytospora chrysosperma TaxID=252740 RepID=A0A423WP60_CYTCH|nr:hypothetical protein VSDG_00279 [Valsa sordida]